MSRQKVRDHLEIIKHQRAQATDRATYAQLTRQADRARGVLIVRNILSGLTLPMDFILGTCRPLPPDCKKDMCNGALNRLPEHPCDLGMAGYGAAGASIAVSGAALGAGMISGGAVGLVFGRPKEGAAVGTLLIGTPVLAASTLATSALTEVLAAPSLGIKAAGTGLGIALGWFIGLMHAPLAARKHVAA